MTTQRTGTMILLRSVLLVFLLSVVPGIVLAQTDPQYCSSDGKYCATFVQFASDKFTTYIELTGGVLTCPSGGGSTSNARIEFSGTLSSIPQFIVATSEIASPVYGYDTIRPGQVYLHFNYEKFGCRGPLSDDCGIHRDSFDIAPDSEICVGDGGFGGGGFGG